MMVQYFTRVGAVLGLVVTAAPAFATLQYLSRGL
jgi:hypothetical protein